jgi:DNA invertase Pin-like site-specific DNA recombinase
VRELKQQGLGATEIAKALKIGRASVYRVLETS